MHNNDLTQFAQLLTLTASQYGKEINEIHINFYWDGLRDLELSAVRSAVTRHIVNPETGQFMPKISDIRKFALGTATDSAMAAWSVVDRAIRTVGPYQSVTFDDAIIHHVLGEMGGWITLCDKTEDQWPFLAKEFQTRYRSVKNRGERFVFSPYLCGINERDNQAQGLPPAPPVLIGDHEKAQFVLKSGSFADTVLRVTRISEMSETRQKALQGDGTG